MIALFKRNFILLEILNVFALKYLIHSDMYKRVKSKKQNLVSALLYYNSCILYTQYADFELALNEFNFCGNLNYYSAVPKNYIQIS